MTKRLTAAQVATRRIADELRKQREAFEQRERDLGRGEPQTYHEAVRDLSLSQRHDLPPNDKSLTIICEQYGREVSGLASNNKKLRDDAAEKGNAWQREADQIWKTQPDLSKSGVERIILSRMPKGDRPKDGTIRKRIKKK